jgi:hypothetical protein
MQDEPKATEILTAVARFLRDTVVSQATPLVAFQARVAANAVDLCARQIALAPASDAAEADSLRALLGRDGSLADLNAALAEGIASGALADTPGLTDQPRYSGHLAALKDA